MTLTLYFGEDKMYFFGGEIVFEMSFRMIIFLSSCCQDLGEQLNNTYLDWIEGYF